MYVLFLLVLELFKVLAVSIIMKFKKKIQEKCIFYIRFNQHLYIGKRLVFIYMKFLFDFLC